MAFVEYVSKQEREKITEKLIDAMCRNAPEEEIDRIMTQLPVLPCLAMSLKESIGLDGLLRSDLNLYDAVQEYGEDFLKS